VEKAEDMESALGQSKKARAEGTEADGSIGVVPRLYRARQLAANRKLWKSGVFFDLGRAAGLATDCKPAPGQNSAGFSHFS
jgi:hypothetical protein